MGFSIPKWEIRASDWLDANIFPAPNDTTPAHTERMQYRLLIEKEANKIQMCVKSCKTLPQTYTIIKMVMALLRRHRDTGNNAMLKGCVGSIMMELERKQHQIQSKM